MKKLTLIAVLLFAGKVNAQLTNTAVDSATSRLRIVSQEIVMQFELSDEYREAKEEFQSCSDEVNRIEKDAIARLQTRDAYREISENIASVSFQLDTADKQDRIFLSQQLLNLRSIRSAMERDSYSTTEYKDASEKLDRAVKVLSILENKKRLAVFSSREWKLAWEQLQSAKISRAELLAARANCFECNWRRVYLCR